MGDRDIVYFRQCSTWAWTRTRGVAQTMSMEVQITLLEMWLFGGEFITQQNKIEEKKIISGRGEALGNAIGWGVCKKVNMFTKYSF